MRPARDSGLRPPARQASWPRPGDLARTLQSRSAVSLSSVERLPPRPRSAVEPKALKGFKTVVRGDGPSCLHLWPSSPEWLQAMAEAGWTILTPFSMIESPRVERADGLLIEGVLRLLRALPQASWRKRGRADSAGAKARPGAP